LLTFLRLIVVRYITSSQGRPQLLVGRPVDGLPTQYRPRPGRPRPTRPRPGSAPSFYIRAIISV